MPQLFWFISVFGIIATIFRSRIPGLKVPPFPLMIPHLLVTMAYTPNSKKGGKMDHETAMDLLKLAKSLVKEECDENLPDLLIDIAQKAIQAYNDFTGRPMDLYLLGA